MNVSVQYSGEDAITDDERSRTWTHGPHTGTFFNSEFIDTRPVTLEDGTYDFTEAYMKAMEEFLKLQPRAAEGKALEIRIIA